ncbi:MAG: ribulokinase [Ferruginibacter sp.]
MQPAYVIGLDFGTDSVRALVVNTEDGKEMSSGVAYYPRWKKGLYCDAAHSRFRQHPSDHMEAMQQAVKQALAALDTGTVQQIKSIALDATGSTPGPVDEAGTPLALLPGFEEDPDAMFILWKDHTAQKEADEINALAHAWAVDYTAYSGGLYSPEWFWSKILHTIRVNQKVREKAFSWVEHCDWLTALLTGETNPLFIKRNRSAAGHKAMWNENFGGLPSENFLRTLDPYLGDLKNRLYKDTTEADHPAGHLCAEWADKFGLPEGITVAAGSIDAHVGAVGANIEPYTLVKVMGTSTCDMVVVPNEPHQHTLVKGICGQVNGSILPGMLGLEAGQSAFGDVYQWYVRILSFTLDSAATGIITEEQANSIQENILPLLDEKAKTLPVTENDPVALDWINGRRTPDVDLSLKAAIAGLQLGTDAVTIFKALVEATAFGSRAIVQRFEEQGIPIHKVIAIGGISRKSGFVMQTLANVLNRPIRVMRSEQACALGAAMLAATAAGIYSSVAEAQQKMKTGIEKEYLPEKNKAAVYEKLYSRYLALGRFTG